MKRTVAVLSVLLATAALSAQDADRTKRFVERPLKKALAAPPDTVDLREATGLVWQEGLEAVVNRGKPIVLLQLLGRFDDVYC